MSPAGRFDPLDSYKDVEDSTYGKRPLGKDGYSVSKLLGEILEYNQDADSYRVMPIGSPGQPAAPSTEPFYSVPRKVDNPGELAPIPNGTVVVVDLVLGFPYIDGILPMDATRDAVEDNLALPQVGSTAESKSQSPPDENDAYWRRPDTPKDLLQGEYYKGSPEGNYLAVLRGKLNRLYGSSRAQIMTLGAQNLIKLICEDYEHLHAMGITKIVNEGGRNSLMFRGSADQKTQPDSEKDVWPIQLDVGEKGDLFDLRFHSEEGRLVSRIHFSADGKVTITGIKGVDLVNAGGGTQREEIGGDRVLKIGASYRQTIQENKKTTILGAKTARVSESNTLVVGNDNSQMTSRNKITSVGGNYALTITGGNALYATPLNVAADIKVQNGSYNIAIGHPIISSIKAKPGYNLFVYNGNITMGEEPKKQLSTPSVLATINLNTSKPGTVGLGGFAPASGQLNNICKYHAMSFDPFSAMMKKLLDYVDGHRHLTAWGPSEKPMITSSLTVGPLVEPCMSTRVYINP